MQLDSVTRYMQAAVHYELQGEERLGSYLVVTPAVQDGHELAKCKFQWHRVSMDGHKAEPIVGGLKV